MKKILSEIVIIVIIPILLFFVNQYIRLINLNIFPNINLIYFTLIAFNTNYKTTYLLSFTLGFFEDYYFSSFFGINIFSYLILGIVFNFIKNIFKNDTKINSILNIFIATLIYGNIKYFLNIYLSKGNLEMFEFIKLISAEAIINILLVLIIYLPISKIKNLLMNIYKKNNIYTRYF